MVILPTEKRIDWARPPVVVFSLIVINLLVFIGLQSRDAAIYERTVEFYQTSTLADREWPAYVDYRLRSGNIEEQTLEQQRHINQLKMAFDPQFDRYLQETIPLYAVNEFEQLNWRAERDELKALVGSISSQAFGLSTHTFSIVNLFTYQFLHADWMHLIGNMVFLLICGFAVEASLGSRRFALFYLLGGVGAGLIFQAVSITNQQFNYLTGASGSVSAVMAMYVTLFRLKKIEFFYWLFIFVGYFRAPALLLLPLYILLEVSQWYSSSNSNIAYSAHIGGFITGFALIFLAQRLSSNAIDDSYIEQQQAVDQEKKTLDRVYRSIADYEFDKALTQLEPLITKSKTPTPLQEIKFNLLSALGGEAKFQFYIQCIESNITFDRLNHSLIDWWQTLSEQEQLNISENNRAKIALRLIDLDQFKQSETILYQLVDNHYKQPIVAKLARRLAHFYERQGIVSQKVRLDELANALMRTGIHDHRTELPKL